MQHIGRVVDGRLVHERRLQLLVAAVVGHPRVLEVRVLLVLLVQLRVRLDLGAPLLLVARLPAAPAAERLEAPPEEHVDRVVVELAARHELLQLAADRGVEGEAVGPRHGGRVGPLVQVVQLAEAPDGRRVLDRFEELEVGRHEQLDLDRYRLAADRELELPLALHLVVRVADRRRAVAE
eukprot:6722728-Prymnesium_polylepis.1